MRRAVILWIVILSCALGLSAQAQASTPLLDMLALVPDIPAAHEFPAYVDYRAVFATRPGAPVVSSWQDWQRYTSAGNPERGLLLAALEGIASGPQFLNYLGSAGDYSQTVGFDFFAVDRSMTFGNPPSNVLILQGSFDKGAVIQAHLRRGYTQTIVNGLTVLCGAAGCENGNRLDPSRIDRSNPFGGELGRSEPVLVTDQVLASSPNAAALTAAAGAVAGQSPTLADDPDFHAAAEAITSGGTLIQTMFVNPADVGTASDALTAAHLSPSQLKADEDQLRLSFIPLPQYNLLAFADTATATEQQALVALVYTLPADAQDAGELFATRLHDYQSLAEARPFSDLLADRGVTSIETSVFTASTGRAVMLLTIHAPLATAAIPEDAHVPVSSSMVYHLLIQALYNRDIGWLATQF